MDNNVCRCFRAQGKGGCLHRVAAKELTRGFNDMDVSYITAYTHYGSLL